MRCATVASGMRKARAISSVVNPPRSRSVSATRASAERIGWQAMKIRRSRSSSIRPPSRSASIASSAPSSSASGALYSDVRSPSSSRYLRSRRTLRRIRSIARRFAAVINHAAGFRGTPDCGHCSSAATNASCASSSANPTSRTNRVRPAISLADSIRQTASIVRRVWSASITSTPSMLVVRGQLLAPFHPAVLRFRRQCGAEVV